MSDQNCACTRPESVKLPITGLSFDVAKSALPAGEGPSREELIQLIEEVLQSHSGGEGSGTGRRWESEWFAIAKNAICVFQHNLGIASPWLSNARLVFRVETAASGWAVGDIVFGDGSNYQCSNSAGTELGWAITVAENTAHLTLGDSPTIINNAKSGGKGALPKANVVGKLVLEY